MLMHDVPGYVRVQDDKDEKQCWQAHESTFAALMYKFILCSSTWSIVDLAHQAANDSIVSSLREHVPRVLHHFLGITDSAWFLPNMYITCKIKMFWSRRPSSTFLP